MKSLQLKTVITKVALAASVSVIALTSAQAGGFAVREQSAVAQGSSFAGAASQSNLSAMYWNAAGVTHENGTNTESHLSFILPSSEVDVTGGTLAGLIALGANPTTGDLGKKALVPASYGNMQLTGINPNLYVGYSVNAPFGLVTKPDNPNWAGSLISRTTSIFNTVGTPTVGVKIAPGISVGAGAQIGYMEGILKFGQPLQPNIFYNGDDWGYGYTLGATLQPTSSTRIGIGFRSSIEYNLEGTLGDNIIGGRLPADVELTTPEILTISLHQNLSDTVRIMGTYEWTNWSRFNQLDIIPQRSNVVTALAGAIGLPTAGQTYVSLPANWEDGWFGSVGAEADLTDRFTARFGIAYEDSPIKTAAQRLTAVPDADRVWVSGGFSFKVGKLLPFLNATTTLDGSYTHVFIDDADIDRESIINPALTLQGRTSDAAVDIVSLSIRTKFGGPDN